MLVPSPYSPRSYAADQMNAQYLPQYGQGLPGQYPSFTSGSLPSTMTTLSQESSYEYQTPPQNGAYNWGQASTRSMSTGEAEGMSSGFSTPFRTHTYPSFERMAGETQQLRQSTASLMPMGMEGQQGSIPPGFHEPTSYQPMPVEMHQDWPAGAPNQAQQHLSGAARSSYPQNWYMSHPNLTDMREEGSQSHVLPSQSHQARQRQYKPG